MDIETTATLFAPGGKITGPGALRNLLYLGGAWDERGLELTWNTRILARRY